MIVSEAAFQWFCTIATAGGCALYFLLEAISFKCDLNPRADHPVPWRDVIFGKIVMYAIIVIGTVGVLRFHF
jgi:hypothetical protein